MEQIKTVYLVDDDADDQMFIHQALSEVVQGVQIVEIEDGEKLMEALQSGSPQAGPSLILMDMNMPRMNGLEALSLIKSTPGCRHIPIVMISTTSDQALIARVYKQGVNAFITKPVLPAQFEQLAQAINICFLQHYHHSADVTLMARKMQGKQILVIEDDDDHWQLIRQGINRHLPGVNVVNTTDAAGTANFLQGTLGLPMPELVILDLYLPTRELGLELLAWIRQFLAQQKMPPVIIIFSSSGHQHDIQESYTVGASAYLVKTPDLTRSVSYFKHLCYFWWDTVTLPNKGI